MLKNSHPALTLVVALALFGPAFSAQDFPSPYNTETEDSKPLTPVEAAARLQLPPGFKASVFANEPEVQNPIAMTWDARGRLWIAENYTYAEAPRRFDMALRDRVLIFEDKDGDGRADKRSVFTDEAQMLTSIEVGRGGVWAMCPPQLLFIPDADGDDRPDGAAEVVLDGFSVPVESHHNFANGLRFGPDGWLYGRCGGTAPGDIGAPGAAAESRAPLRGGMWRYHPERKVFEALTPGTTNPWGHDWDQHGELFFINTVNGHLWHAITGAHFKRGSTLDPNPHAYELLDQHADHWHFDNAQDWTKSRDGAANALGGGHAHVGMMIYHGDNWPVEYTNRLFTLNMHGYRANQDILERHGSGYVGRHGKDFFIADDKWFRGIELGYGPDGGVFVLDWSDTGECHERNGVHRTSGRIYKITHGDAKRPAVGDLSRLGAAELVKLHTHPNEWFSRQARQQLDRLAHSNPAAKAEAASGLRELLANAPDAREKLRALWSLHVIGAADRSFLETQLGHENEHMRAWAIRLLSDSWPLDSVTSTRRDSDAASKEARALLPGFVRIAREDPSGLVRLVLSSTLQRLPAAERPALAAALVSRKEDAADHNLPLLTWYGLIPVAASQPADLAKVAEVCEWPLTRKFIARRLAEDIEKNPAPINTLLELTSSKPAEFQTDIIAGLSEGLTGWRKARKPAAWDGLAAKLAQATDSGLRDRVRDLSVLFGDGRALDDVKKIALDEKADLGVRKAALQTLLDNRPPDLREICEKLLSVRFLNPLAARGLATVDDPEIGKKLAAAWSRFHLSERPQLLAVLVSRASFAMPLLDAVEKGRVPRADITPYHARQIQSLNDPKLNERLAQVWGQLADANVAKQPQIAQLRQQLTPSILAQADKSAGRAVFNQACASCHRMYGQGGDLGPDLTGSGRTHLDYLLENIVDPAAMVSADYRLTILTLKDGRVLNGFITASTDRTVTLRTMTETTTLERTEIANKQELPQSLMPEGLLQALSETQVRDLIGYLMHPNQVPLPAAK